MKILHISTHLNIGGIASYIANVSAELKKRGHKVIVASSGGDMVERLIEDSIAHVELNVKTKSELSPRLIPALARLMALIKIEGIEVIHAHTRVTQVLACAASRLAGIPYVATCHGFFKERLGRKIFKCWGDKTIAISDAVRDHLIKDFNVPAERIELVYNGVELERFRKHFTDQEKDALRNNLGLKPGPVIGAIGRLSPVKGYQYLVEAFSMLCNEYKDLNLLMVGDGPEKENLKSLCRELKIAESVTFIPPIPDTPKTLSIMDLFVSSSVQEGLGLSIVESLAAGRPVVASDVGGVSSIVKNDKTGMLVKPEDSQALASGISVILKDPGLRERLQKDGRRLVEENFTIKKMVDKIEGVYSTWIT